MTLKKSSADTFRFTFINTMKKNCLIPILVFVFNLVYQLFGPVSRFLNEKYSGAFGYGLEKSVYGFSNPNSDFFGVIFTAAMLLCPFILAVFTFKYMMNKSAVNVYYSLGVTRTSMFFGKFAAGVTMAVASQIIPLVAAMIANIALFGSTAELWRTFIYMLLNYTVLEIFVFAVTAATFSLVGTVIEGLVFSVLYFVSPIVLTAYIEFLFKHFLVGHIQNTAPWVTGTGNYQILGEGILKASRIDVVNYVLDFLTFPYSSDMRIRYSLVEGPYDWNVLDYRPFIIWTIITVAVVLLGWLAFKKRKVEIAGFMGSNPKATFAGVFIVATFLSSTLLPELISTDFTIGKTTLAVLTVIIFAIVYFVVDAISLRSIKKMGKTLWKLPLHLAIYSLGIIIFATGFFGFKTRIPAVDKIESVSIRTNTGDMMIGPDNVGYRDYYFYGYDEYYLPAVLSVSEERDFRLIGGFTDAEDIQRAIDVHRMLIDCSGTSVYEESLSKPYGERVRPVSITIVYHLKNGKTLQRNYSVANDEILCKLAEFTETDRYKELVLKPYKDGSEYIVEGENPEEEFHLDLNHYMTVFSDNYQVGFASPNLTRITPMPENELNTGLKSDILNAIGKDVEAGTLPLNYKSDSKIIGYIVFKNYTDVSKEYYIDISENSFDVDGEPAVDAEVIYVDKMVSEEETVFSMVSEEGFSIPVYENMANTVKYINDNGYAEYFVNEKTPYAVKLWDGVSGVVSDNYYQFNSKTMLFNGTVYYPPVDEQYGEAASMPENAQVITQNPELIAEYESRARMLYLTCYNGVYAQFLFEDGTSTFAYIPE